MHLLSPSTSCNLTSKVQKYSFHLKYCCQHRCFWTEKEFTTTLISSWVFVVLELSFLRIRWRFSPQDSMWAENPPLSTWRRLIITLTKQTFSGAPLHFAFGPHSSVLGSHSPRTPQRCVGTLLYLWTYESSSRVLYNRKFAPARLRCSRNRRQGSFSRSVRRLSV